MSILQTATASTERWLYTSFWFLGVFNNSSFVIMLAAATNIEEGGVGIVYIASIMPGVIMKTSAPYWFDKVSYKTRAVACSLLMAASFVFVASFSALPLQLFGVALASTQCSMGEASMLALASQYSSSSSSSSSSSTSSKRGNRRDDTTQGEEGAEKAAASVLAASSPGAETLTAWASGTGFAGVFGYAWLTVLHEWCGLPFSATILLALVLPLAWMFFFLKLPPPPPAPPTSHVSASAEGAAVYGPLADSSDSSESPSSPSASPEATSPRLLTPSLNGGEDEEQAVLVGVGKHGGGHGDNGAVVCEERVGSGPLELGWRARLAFFASLWPFTVPLLVVYVSEYALQSGVWSAYGVPSPKSEHSRELFYSYANWCYQLGVFVSRSSGMLFSPSIKALWCLPVLQFCLLGLFWVDAAAKDPAWHSEGVLGFCMLAGLAGGSVYVHGFKLVASSVPSERRELAMASASVSADVGVLLGSVSGLFIQACIFKRQGISGAEVDGSFCTTR